jgi:hypothetical protein
MDLHSFSKLDPDPRSLKKLDPDLLKVTADPKLWFLNLSTRYFLNKTPEPW